MWISALQHRIPKHQLISVTDNLGDKVQYSYDLKGHRTHTATLDPNGSLVRSIDTGYDVFEYSRTAPRVEHSVFRA